MKTLILSYFIPSIIFLFPLLSSGQTTIWEEDFETNGAGTRYTVTNEFFDGKDDYFGRVYGPTEEYGGSGTGDVIDVIGNGGSSTQNGMYSGYHGNHFVAGEDQDDNGGDEIDEKSITFNTIDISNASGLTFKGLFGAGNTNACTGNAYDAADHIKVYYNVDGTGEQLALCFNADLECNISGDISNEPLHHDPDCDGDGGEGAMMTNALMERTFAIPDGSTLTLRIETHMDSANEEVAFDWFRVEAVSVSSPCPAAGTVWYVDASAAAGGTGTSWDCAFQYLQDALAAAGSGQQIWVADGTYTPDQGVGYTPGNRLHSFVMKNGVAIYGGFSGGETMLSQRNSDPATNGTVLSGEIGGAGNSDNSYHVIFNNNNGLDGSAVLDGFTISGGNSDTFGGGMYNSFSSPTVTNCSFSGNSADRSGGGMYNISSSPTVTNCSFSGNSADRLGGGMYNISSSPTVTNCSFSGNSANFGGGMFNNSSSPTVTNCSFSGNSADFGGGMYNISSSPTVTNCSFSGNSADTFGGGMFNNSSSPTVTNCSFSGNSADIRGGGMFNNSSTSPTVTNCSFSGNSASLGGGMYNSSTSPTVTNCILWGNGTEIVSASGSTPSVTFSIVQGGYTGTGNLNVDPLFVSQPPIGLGTMGDLRLQPCSPAIDAGTNGPNVPTTDFDGDARPQGAGIDMGFDENGASCLTPELDLRNAADDDDILNGSSLRTVALGTEYGSVCVNGGMVTNTFRAENNGTADLTFGTDALALTNTTDFSIITDLPNGGTLAPGEVATFSIQFDPSTTGTRTCTVTIRSDDADEDPYTFLIGGFGVATPTAAAAGTDQTICGTMATLAGNNPSVGTGTWTEVTGDGNGSFANTNVHNTTFTGTQGVSYTLRWTVTNAPCPASTDDVNISLAQNPTTANAGPDQAVCGTMATLAGNNPAVGTGTWTEVTGDGNGSFANANVHNTTFTGTQGVNYSLRWTVTNAPCPASTDDVVIDLQNNGVSVSVSPSSVTEDGATNLVFTFTRACTANVVTVNFDVGGSLNSFNDYTTSGATTINSFNGTVTFGVGEATKQVTINPTTDNKPEQDETIMLTVTAGSGYTVGTPSSATGTVEDDDSATISISDVTMNEGDAGSVNFCFNISVSTMPEEGITMTASTANGTATNGGGATGQNDYIPKTDFVNINSDFPSPQQFCVTVLSDDVVELDESFFVNLTGLMTNGQDVTFADSQGEGTILNDDQAVISFASTPYSTNEGNSGTTLYLITLNSSNPIDIGYSFAIAQSDGTATAADNDYIAGLVGPLNVPGISGNIPSNLPGINGDTKVEPDETFQLTLSEDNFQGRNIVFAGGMPFISTTVTILNDDIDFGDAPDPTYPTLSANAGPSHGGSNLRLGATNDGEADGQPSANADGDMAEDDGVTFTSSLIAGTMATVDVTASEAGRLEAWIDFNQNGNFNDPGENFINNDLISAGVNNLNFMVPATAVQGTTFARFRLFDSSIEGGLAPTGPTGAGEVEDYQVAVISTQFSIDDPMVNEGDAGTTNLSFTVSRSTNGAASSVDYAITGGTATSGDDYQALAAGTVNFAAGGALTQMVNVVVNGDMIVELDETVEISLSNPVNGTIADGSGTGTIKNDDSAIVTMSNPFITEGDAGSLILTFNVNVDKAVDVPVNFDFATSDGTATTADNDYVANSGSSNIPMGDFVAYLQVSENGDCQIEANEIFNMTLSNLMAMGRDVTFAGGGMTLGSTGTINNDDALPEIYIPAEFTQSNDPNQCSATVTVPKASTASICGTGTLEFRYRQVMPAPVGAWSAWIPEANNTQVFAVGRHEVEWRITDDSGANVGNFFFNVVDGQGPMINCMAYTAQLDANGNASITPTDVYAGGGDNCSPVTLVSVSPNTFDCSNLGDVTVTLNAVDDASNPGSCTATVTVVDGIAPDIVCKNISIDLDENGMASIVPSDVDGGTTDNCGFTLSLDDSDFECSDIPSTVVTLFATDGTNTSSCPATVTVNDVTKPTVLCMDATVYLDGTGNVSITPATVFAGSSDNCGFIGITGFGPTDFDCDDIGENTVTLNVTDGNGNDNFCTATVTVADDIPAVVACNSLSLSLNSMGQASITPADLFDATNSTDNCGTFNLTGLSQSDFTCVDEGVNTITLYVEDAGGNVSTCTGTVTIGEFFEIVSVTHTDESCPGAGDGTISIVATEPTGQLLYSVDGGDTWQATGEFEFLSPGTYDIVVQVYGIPSLCVKTATETVGTQSGGGMTWYADHDNDGYSSGITLVQCQQPTGFKLAADLIATSGDCNDYNADEFPGQTWMKDADGDGFTDGTTLTSCSQPTGYVVSAQMGDCDDTNPAVNPGATEICNGIDDNCDGNIDEGTSGGLTFMGNVIFTNQAQVDAFSQCYSVIDGQLHIFNSGISDISNLINLTEVTGNVFIKSTTLTSLTGLDNLTTIGGFLKIQSNNSLTTLNGLDAVTSVGSYLRVYRNNNLTDCCAIHDLLANGGVGGNITISRNDTGCDSVSEIEDDCAGGNNLIAPPTSDLFTSIDAEAFEMNVFPNPNGGIFQVAIIGATEGANLRMMDATGQVKWMKEVTEGNGTYPVKMGRLVTGIYFLQYTDGENSWTEKVIIR